MHEVIKYLLNPEQMRTKPGMGLHCKDLSATGDLNTKQPKSIIHIMQSLQQACL
jgi:hypothetical protein